MRKCEASIFTSAYSESATKLDRAAMVLLSLSNFLVNRYKKTSLIVDGIGILLNEALGSNLKYFLHGACHSGMGARVLLIVFASTFF